MNASSVHSLTPSTRGAVETRLALAVAGLVALATALMLEATRVFLSYTVFVVDQSERVKLGAIAVGVFLAAGLASVIVRWCGTRNGIVASSALILGARLLLQFWEEPSARIVLGATALICWSWLLVPLLGVARDAAAFGVGLGLGIDLAVRIALLSVDLPWMPSLAKDLTTLALGALVVLSLAVVARTGLPSRREPTGRFVASLIAVGPGLAVYHLTVGNLGLIETKADRSPAAFGLWLLLGLLLGLHVSQEAAIGDRLSRRHDLEAVALTLLAPAGVWLLWQEVGFGMGWVFLAAAGLAVLLVRALRSGGGASTADGLGRTTLWLTVGMLLFAAIIFAYFTFSGHPFLIVVAVLLLVVGAWLPGYPSPSAFPVRFARTGWVSLVPVVVVAIAPGIALLTTDEVNAGAPLGRDVTVMTYNIQLGFSRDNHWSLEQTARTIEAQDPDVVILQEVSRGWIIASGVDEVRWLSERLDMPVVFGAASRDGLWGNAILTKAPIKSKLVTIFSSTENLRRGAIVLQLETEAGDLWVIGTHLDNPDDAGAVRLEQVEQVIGVWDGKTPAILAGDFNAPPDSDVLAALSAAGFVDTGAAFPPETYTMEDRRRIDYIMTAGPIAMRDVRIPDVWTSDHKPVVAELTLGG